MTVTVPSLTDRLAEAQLALHRLQLGQSFVEVTVNGYATKFTPAKLDILQAYVDDLQAQVNGSSTRGALGFVF
jgi:hypothetical protein